jgi:hypothetical protein
MTSQQIVRIPDPFVGDYDADKIFELRANETWFASGFFDRNQHKYIIQIGHGQGADFFIVEGYFTLRDLIREGLPGAVIEEGEFREADWVDPEPVAQMPPRDDTKALLELTMDWLYLEPENSYSLARFYFECELAQE